jgi:hypothetical protein
MAHPEASITAQAISVDPSKWCPFSVSRSLPDRRFRGQREAWAAPGRARRIEGMKVNHTADLAVADLQAELVALREYQADAADRFAAVVRQRTEAEAEVGRLRKTLAEVQEAATALASETREACALQSSPCPECYQGVYGEHAYPCPDCLGTARAVVPEPVRAFVREAVTEQRERCARLADSLAIALSDREEPEFSSDAAACAVKELASAIRRGD